MYHALHQVRDVQLFGARVVYHVVGMLQEFIELGGDFQFVLHVFGNAFYLFHEIVLQGAV